MPPAVAFEFDQGAYLKGVDYYWRVEERLWNIDAEPDPLKRREYIIGRPIRETLGVKTTRISEIDLISHFKVVSKEEAKAAIDARHSSERGEESAG